YSEIIVCRDERGVERERLAQEVDRGVEIAARVTDAPEQEPGFGAVRGARQQGAQAAFGVLHPACVELGSRRLLNALGPGGGFRPARPVARPGRALRAAPL